MDPVEIRLSRKIFFKGSVARGFFDKSARPPSSEGPLKYESACAADFSLLNLPKGKSLGRSKPATNS